MARIFGKKSGVLFARERQLATKRELKKWGKLGSSFFLKVKKSVLDDAKQRKQKVKKRSKDRAI